MKFKLSSPVLPALYIAICLPAVSLASEDDVKSLFSIKDVEVVSVSKNPEKAFDAASAIFVLSNEDIKRSGATTIPDALRMVPGLEVAQIDSSHWAITSRGFNRQYANKLLVMIDGRTVYTPLFSGTYWNTQDVMLEDVSRIEVIRGPGATLWGANAVNGIINIITKDARLTQGKLVSGMYGNQEKGTVSTRYGGKTENDIYYRVYGKFDDHGPSYKLSGQKDNNQWENAQTGFRMDWQKTARDSITIQGDAYSGYNEWPLSLPGIKSPIISDEDTSGANIRGKWSSVLSSTSKIDVQTYLDHTEHDVAIFKHDQTTFNTDFQHTLTSLTNNEIIWGLGYRLIQDDLQGKPINGVTYLNYVPNASSNNLYSTFAQDKITLSPNKLFLTIGSKLEHNYYTGFELQPSARLAWLPTDNQTVWTSVSRAVRTPSRGEEGLTLVAAGNSSHFIDQIGNSDMQSEKLIAYEVGYRVIPKPNLSFDIATFYNDYDSLRSFELTNGNYVAANKSYGETHGIELSSDWSVTNDWHLVADYSFLMINLHNKPGGTDNITTDGRASPANQYKIASHLNLPYNVKLDNMLYYVNSLDVFNIPSYTRFDSNITWEARKGLELSLVGQNLFDDRHQEFTKALYSVSNEFGRTVYGKVTYRF